MFFLEKLKKTRRNATQNNRPKTTQMTDKSFIKRANRKTLLEGL